jgi:hypothetical protein
VSSLPIHFHQLPKFSIVIVVWWLAWLNSNTFRAGETEEFRKTRFFWSVEMTNRIEYFEQSEGNSGVLRCWGNG